MIPPSPNFGSRLTKLAVHEISAAVAAFDILLPSHGTDAAPPNLEPAAVNSAAHHASAPGRVLFNSHAEPAAFRALRAPESIRATGAQASYTVDTLHRLRALLPSALLLASAGCSFAPDVATVPNATVAGTHVEVDADRFDTFRVLSVDGVPVLPVRTTRMAGMAVASRPTA